MHENKFEKQVQEKMEELQFVPSDAVWANVDKEINKDKKRRRPVFWLFFFFGLLLLGGGYFFSVNNKSNIQASKALNYKKEENKVQANKAEENKVQADKGQEQKVLKNKKQEIREEDKAKENRKEKSKWQENKIQEDKTQEKIHKNYLSQDRKSSQSLRQKRQMANSAAIKTNEEKRNDNGVSDFQHLENKPSEKNIVAEKMNDVADNNTLANATKIDLSADKKNTADSLVNKKATVVANNKTAIKDAVTDKKMAVTKQKKSSAWQIGFTAGSGISNINQSLFKSTYVTNPIAYSNVTAGPNGYPVVYSSSKINPGFSFSAGVFVNKHFSKGVTFSAGMNYHYYSTKIHTGNAVDSPVSVYPQTALAFQANRYYRNGKSNVYINDYHFIELPLSINFQLNKSKTAPLIWEAGLSLLYLVNSNALQFDPVKGVYYKNNALFNKTQLNANTAIMLGLHIHKSELQLGPQFQYGLTGLLNKSTGNPEHLFYGGLKISFIPRKK